MVKGMKDFVAEAKAFVDEISPHDAHEAATQNRALVLDVREAEELRVTGRVAGSCHVPRGMLEPKADPDGPHSEDLVAALRENRPVHVLCATGGRATLAARTLTQMGYTALVISGGAKGWQEAGLSLEK